jgi:hypothetical protein
MVAILVRKVQRFFSTFILFLSYPLRHASTNLTTFQQRERERGKFEKGGKQKDTANKTYLIEYQKNHLEIVRSIF